MRKNEEVEILCTDLSDQGYGIGHVQGKTVFVKDLLPSEKAKVKIIKDQSRFAIGIVSERYNDSADRAEPFCAHNGACGGCVFWNLNYPAQLKWHNRQLEELFHRVDPEIKVLPILGMNEPYHYRNKAQFPVTVKDDQIQSGFYRNHSHTIVDMESCAIQQPQINEIYQWIKDHLSLKQARALRHIFIRYARKSGQGQVVFIGEKNVRLDDLAKRLVEAFPWITSVVFNEKTGKDNVILGEKYQVLEGKDWIEEDCLGLKIHLHFKSFFQVNPEQMEKLYQTALDLAGLDGSQEVIDLYAGTGTIGMLAAREAKHVTSVEIVPEAVENARENIRLNQIGNLDALCMDASKFVTERTEPVDVLFVDPPRKGLDEKGVEHIIRLAPDKIVYISCNPRTLARDLERFAPAGYRASVIQPVDMFAHTGNVESVALITRNGNKAKSQDKQ